MEEGYFYHVVWAESGDKISDSWKPHHPLFRTPGATKNMDLVNLLFRLREVKPALTYDNFLKRRDVQAPMTASDDGMRVVNNLKLAMDLAGIDTPKLNDVVKEFEKREKTSNHILAQRSDRVALEVFVKLLVRRER